MILGLENQLLIKSTEWMSIGLKDGGERINNECHGKRRFIKIDTAREQWASFHIKAEPSWRDLNAFHTDSPSSMSGNVYCPGRHRPGECQRTPLKFPLTPDISWVCLVRGGHRMGRSKIRFEKRQMMGNTVWKC